MTSFPIPSLHLGLSLSASDVILQGGTALGMTRLPGITVVLVGVFS